MIYRRPGHTPPATAPILETERLRLRPVALADFEACFDIWNDPDVYRYAGGKPRTRPSIWTKLQIMTGHWALAGYGYWAVEERATGAYLGEIGLQDALRGMIEAVKGLPEAGWGLASAVHGRGLGTEGLAAVFDWIDTHLDAPACWAMIDPENAPSLRLAERFGFKRETDTVYEGEAVRIFLRPRGG
ncbi:MAG: GNAT family N-acetyltransferase [Pseudomonadota bacterium]